jgi:phosphoribosylaminoimidazolecarboxamide formyltransferase/IMP cyclohydrolase
MSSALLPVKSALISVFSKEGLEPVIRCLQKHGVRLYSTGGTQTYLEKLGAEVTAVETLTDYPSILGGRVKTLHPKVFGGILARRENEADTAQLDEYAIPEFDLVIVDLYPFEHTLAEAQDPHGADRAAVVEKIDIGGISLIRAAAKNHADVLVCASRKQYDRLLDILQSQNGASTAQDRLHMACLAFEESSRYDTAIHNWFWEGVRRQHDAGRRATEPEASSDQGAGLAGPQNGAKTPQSPSPESPACTLDPALAINFGVSRPLRYGENPHQQGRFYGRLQDAFEQVHGKELSYNNLVDLDSAVELISEFQHDEPTFAILKHTNPCGLATRPTLKEAYAAALAGDPVSAFGGVLIANRPIDVETAALVHDLFCEMVVAPGYSHEALAMLKGKKNRILLVQKMRDFGALKYRKLLNGVLLQEADKRTETAADFNAVTAHEPTAAQQADLLFAIKAVKHLKSNAIALAANRQLIGIGTGQTSRIDAMQQALDKARRFNFDTAKAVLASDAFFPFADGVALAADAGIRAIAQPGGSMRDQESIDFCNNAGIAMVFTGLRHFKH